jgi:hypothetical protein
VGGKSGTTIGFHYFFDILFGLSRGPINEVRAIKVGDKMAWENNGRLQVEMVGDPVGRIEKPDLFGGEKKEGGICGAFWIFWGKSGQVLPGAGPTLTLKKPTGRMTIPSVKASVGGLVGEFRGATTLWYSGLISSMNPYPKEWKFRLRRTTEGWQFPSWYPDKATIWLENGSIMAMNPAHIIYECLTNKSWGRGLPTSMIDGDDGGTFVTAANALCEEGFGLCFIWKRQEDVGPFIQIVLEHIGATLYLNPVTGRMSLRLIRADYDEEDLPLFTPSSGLLDIKEDDSSSQDSAFNEVISTGHDPNTDTDIQVRVPNLAARHSQGAANSEPKDYPGIPTKALLLRVTQRDLKAHASGLKNFQVILDRRGWQLTPGAPFRVSDPRRGIENIVLRVGEKSGGSTRDGRISIKALQDVYAMPSSSFIEPVESTWTPPATEAETAEGVLVEADYRQVVKAVGATQAGDLDETAAFAGTLALAPQPTMLEYDLAIRLQGEAEFQVNRTANFTGSGKLTAAITPLQTSFTIDEVYQITEDNIGQAILIDDEQMHLTDYDEDTGTMTVERGVADTIPAEHADNARVWTIDDDYGWDFREFVSGETVEAKVLTRTSSDLLEEEFAPTLSLGLSGRQGRPYPPGDVKVDGTSIYLLGTTVVPEPDLTWTHRDRLLQADVLVSHTEASVGPEAGTTYTARVFGSDGVTLLREEDLIAGTTWQYDATMQTADGSPGGVWMELESERDGLASYQAYRFFVVLNTGYGYGYGLNYGGA